MLWRNIELSIADASEVYPRAAALFPYSRDDRSLSTPLEISKNDIRRALHAAGCVDNLIVEGIINAWERGLSLGNEIEDVMTRGVRGSNEQNIL